MNSFPLRSAASRPHPLSIIAARVGAPPPGGGEIEITGIAPLAAAGPRDLGFLADRHYLGDLPGSGAGALLVSRSLENLLDGDSRPRLVVDDAHRALADILAILRPEEPMEAEIHPTAILGRGVTIGARARISPYAVVEEDAILGDDVSIGAHAVVGAAARIGSGTRLLPHAVVYPGTVLGDRVILHAGARVGVDGFGYVHHSGAHHKVPQVGACVVEDDVEIGANTTIDRGSIGETRVKAGSKLDNLVHLGHNVAVGPLALLAAQVGVAGSVTLGQGVLAGGQSGVAGHLTVGDGAQLSARAGVIGDVPPGSIVMGFPARPRREFLRTLAAQGKVPDVLRRLRRLEESFRDGDARESEAKDSPK